MSNEIDLAKALRNLAAQLESLRNEFQAKSFQTEKRWVELTRRIHKLENFIEKHSGLLPEEKTAAADVDASASGFGLSPAARAAAGVAEAHASRVAPSPEEKPAAWPAAQKPVAVDGVPAFPPKEAFEKARAEVRERLAQPEAAARPAAAPTVAELAASLGREVTVPPPAAVATPTAIPPLSAVAPATAIPTATTAHTVAVSPAGPPKLTAPPIRHEEKPAPQRMDAPAADRLGYAPSPSAPRPSKPRTPPPPPPPPPPPKPLDWADIEQLAATWGTRVGAFIVVLGLGYLLSIGFMKLGAFGKALIVYVACFGMLGTGIVMEKLDKYRTWARILIAGGWAGLYVATFLVHYLDSARLIASPLADTTLLIAIAVGMIVHSLWYRSQALTGLAYFVAFVSVALMVQLAPPDERFYSLIATTVLAVSMVFLVYRLRWIYLAALALTACYGIHTFWLNPFLAQFEQPGGHVGMFLPSILMLVIYWLMFTASVFVAKPQFKGEEAVNTSVFVGNYVSFVMLFSYQMGAHHPQLRWIFMAALAVAYAAQAWVFRATKRANAFTLALVIAALSSTAMCYFLVGQDWVAVTWLLQAEALFVAGLLVDERRYRWTAITNFLLVALWLVARDLTSKTQIYPFGYAIPARTISFATVAVVFYVNALLRQAFENRTAHQEPYFWTISFLGTSLWTMLMLQNWFPADLLHIALISAALGAVLLEIGIRRDDSNFQVQALFFAVVGAVSAIAPLCLPDQYYFNHSAIKRILAEVGVIAVVYYIFVRFSRMAKKERVGAGMQQMGVVASGVAALLAVLLIGQEVGTQMPVLLPLAWLIAAATLLEVGAAFSNRALSWEARIIAALAFCASVGYSLWSTAAVGPLPGNFFAVAACILGMYYFHERLLGGAKRGADWADAPDATPIFTWLGSLLLVLLIQCEVWNTSPAFVPVAWLAPMAAFLAVGLKRRSPHFLLQGATLIAVIFGWTLFVNLAGPTDLLPSAADVKQLDAYRLPAVGAVIVAFYAMVALFYRRKFVVEVGKEAKSYDAAVARDTLSWFAFVLLATLITMQLDAGSRGQTLYGWIALAVVLFELGAAIKNDSFVAQGMLLGALSFVRMFVFSRNSVAAIVVSATMYLYFIQMRKADDAGFMRWNKRTLGLGFSWFGAAGLMFLIALAFDDTGWIAPGWAGLVLVLLGVGFGVAEESLVYQSCVAALLVIGALLVQMFGHKNTEACLTAFVGLFAARVVWEFSGRMRKDLVGSEPSAASLLHYVFTVPPALVLAAWIPAALDSDHYLTIGWAGEGLFLLILGFVVTDRLLRIGGLITLGICILKVFYDVAVLDVDRVYKVVGLIGLGLILILTGWIYSKYRDKINRLLAEYIAIRAPFRARVIRSRPEGRSCRFSAPLRGLGHCPRGQTAVIKNVMKQFACAAFLVFLTLVFGFYISCGGSQALDDDASPVDDDACSACTTTAECTAALGVGWTCVDKCCAHVASDDDTTQTCASLWDEMYTGCGLVFLGTAGVQIPEQAIINYCLADEAPYTLDGACASCVKNNPPPNCAAMETCLQSCATST